MERVFSAIPTAEHEVIFWGLMNGFSFLESRKILNQRWTYLLQEGINGILKASVNLSINRDVDHDQYQDPSPTGRIIGVHVSKKVELLFHSKYCGSCTVGPYTVILNGISTKDIKKALSTKKIPETVSFSTIQIPQNSFYTPNSGNYGALFS